MVGYRIMRGRECAALGVRGLHAMPTLRHEARPGLPVVAGTSVYHGVRPGYCQDVFAGRRADSEMRLLRPSEA